MKRGGGEKSNLFLYPLVVLLLEAVIVVPIQLPAAHDAMNNFFVGVNAPLPSAPAKQSCGWNVGCSIGMVGAYLSWVVLMISALAWKVILVVFFPIVLIGILLSITFAVNAFLGLFNIFLVACLIYSVVPFV